jgi:hypothetical protein
VTVVWIDRPSPQLRTTVARCVWTTGDRGG